MSTSCFIYEATTKKLSDFKNIYKYTSHYQAFFAKVSSLLTKTSAYTRKNTKTYFQATILINIGADYSALVSTIQKDWKNKTTNLAETVLQIIRHFKFMKENKKAHNVMQISSSTIPTNRVPKGSYNNPKCIKKGLTTHYTDHY